MTERLMAVLKTLQWVNKIVRFLQNATLIRRGWACLAWAMHASPLLVTLKTLFQRNWGSYGLSVS